MSVIDIKVPAMGESVTEVTLSQWLKGNGEIVKVDEPICEFESDKVTSELRSAVAGKLIWVAQERQDLKIGDLVARIDTSVTSANGASTAPVAPVAVSAPAASSSGTYATGHPSPAAAKILAEAGVKPSEVSGSGKDGRITKEDALKSATSKPVTPPPPATTPAKVETPKTAPVAPKPASIIGGRGERRDKMSRMRRTIAKRLVSAKNNTAMLTTFNEVDMTELIALREKYQDRFVKRYGVKLGFMSLFAKACAKVLMEMPDVNASIDGEDIIYHDYADISIAISTPNGLVVPPVRNCESLKFHEIELAIKGLADKARNNKLGMDEMSGGTFTITNGGIFGSLLSTPILNEPQSAILGMHAMQQRPVVVNGEIKIRTMMYVALSYDHRIIDGSTSVTFLVKVKQLLEDPTALLLDL
jgi:2-oxoglutarate dehydrogenase E2 component (dihydrolipoamide succinyltransferase)